MNIQKIKIEELKHADYNPRKTLQPTDEEYKKIKKSIEHFGYVDPIIINSDNTIIGGHQRATVMKDMGYKEVECVIVDLSKEDEKALNIALNKISGEWDISKLGVLLEELNTIGVMVLTGFDSEEYSKMFGIEEVKEDNYDLDKNTPEIPKTKQGDIWKLGSHRLICGDSTDPQTYNKLLGSKKVDAVITDPPYNVDYEGSNGMKIKNDNFKSSESFYKFLLSFYQCTSNSMKAGSPIYVFHSDVEGVNFRKAMTEAGIDLKQCLIWVKNGMVMCRQDYHWRHEPILYGWKSGAAHSWYGDRDKDTVIDDFINFNPKKMSKGELVELFQKIVDVENERTTVIYNDKPTSSDLHPTMKPITLLGKLLKNSSQKNDFVLDPFCGSGSIIIACEQLGRIAYGIELDEKYVDATVTRYKDFVGKENIKLVREGNEYSYEEIMEGKDEITS